MLLSRNNVSVVLSDNCLMFVLGKRTVCTCGLKEDELSSRPCFPSAKSVPQWESAVCLLKMNLFPVRKPPNGQGIAEKRFPSESAEVCWLEMSSLLHTSLGQRLFVNTKRLYSSTLRSWGSRALRGNKCWWDFSLLSCWLPAITTRNSFPFSLLGHLYTGPWRYVCTSFISMIFS